MPPLRPFVIAALLLLPSGHAVAQPSAKQGPRQTHFSTLIERSYPGKPTAPKSTLAGDDETWTDVPQITPNVIGGSNAAPGAYPWMAALLYSNEANNYSSHFCGGTLVHPYWVVTAAHCLEYSVPSEVDVLLGGHDLTNSSQGTRIAVAEIIIHPEYKTTNIDADVALLRLATPAPAQYTPLPLADDPSLSAPGVVGRILGWGDTTGNESYPSILQEADVPLVSLAVANATEAYAGTLLDTMLPAGYPEGGIDSCTGDSGGPLVVPAPVDAGWVLAGITSFGAACAQPDSYGIYARVDHFRPFLIENVFPGYSAWERQHGVAGEWRGGAVDGLDHFAQYALRRSPAGGLGVRPAAVVHPAGGGEQALRLPVLADRREVDYTVGWSADLGSWPENPLEASVVSEAAAAGDPLASEVVVTSGQSASLPSGFMRVSAVPSDDLAPGPRELAGNGRAHGNLNTGDDVHPDFAGRRQKLYRITGVVAGQQYKFTGRSNDFDVRLELLDASSPGTPLVVADSNGAGGNDEQVVVTAASGVDYLLRVTSAADGGLGNFIVGAFQPAAFQSLPAISVSASLSGMNGALSNTDALDDFYDPDVIYCDDYRLVASAGQYVRIDMSSASVDTTLYVVDEETGLIVISNDDGPGMGTNSRVEFPVRAGRSYRIRATSVYPQETGSYSLTFRYTDPPPSIGVPDTVAGSLSSSDPFDPNYPGYYADDYVLTGASHGQYVTVHLQGTNATFDTYLYIINADTGAVLHFNDDYTGGVVYSRLMFQVDGSINYLIRASTAYSYETGSYTLTTSTPP